jgi:hypothetical protein
LAGHRYQNYTRIQGVIRYPIDHIERARLYEHPHPAFAFLRDTLLEARPPGRVEA